MDDRIAVWAATHRVGLLDDPSVWLGTIQKLGVVWVVLAIVVALAQRRGLRSTVGFALFTALTTLAADSVSFGVKDLTDRARPFEVHDQIHPLYVVHSSSFPAGHAATAFAGAVLLSLAAPRLAPAFVALAALIAWSRVYDGVHYPTDIVAGAAIGAAIGAAAVVLLRLAERAGGAGLRPSWAGRRNVRGTA
jgi:membrane-associated phospholipid phosphatase